MRTPKPGLTKPLPPARARRERREPDSLENEENGVNNFIERLVKALRDIGKK